MHDNSSQKLTHFVYRLNFYDANYAGKHVPAYTWWEGARYYQYGAFERILETQLFDIVKVNGPDHYSLITKF